MPSAPAQQEDLPHVYYFDHPSDKVPDPPYGSGPHEAEARELIRNLHLKYEQRKSQHSPNRTEMIVFRDVPNKPKVREVFALEQGMLLYKDRELRFEKINLLLKSIFYGQECERLEAFRRTDNIAELRLFARQEGCMLHWYFEEDEKKDKEHHTMKIVSKKDAKVIVSAEDEYEEVACEVAKAKFEKKTGKKFEFYCDARLKERLNAVPEMFKGMKPVIRKD